MVGFLEERAGIALYPRPGGLVLIAEAERQHLALQSRQSSNVLSQLVRLDHDLERVSDIPMSISQFIHDLYLGRIADRWAEDLRSSIWRDGNARLFTPQA